VRAGAARREELCRFYFSRITHAVSTTALVGASCFNNKT